MKKITLTIALLVVGFLVWYLAIKPYDYLITFKSKANAGTINQTLKLWNESLEGKNTIKQNNLKELVQQISVENQNFTYKWVITTENDSVNKVKVYITDSENSLKNKITIPFTETDFKIQSKNRVLDFVDELKKHLKQIKIEVVGNSNTPSKFCACVSLSTNQVEKAKGMMQNYSFLDSFIITNGIKTNGTPLIEVTQWNLLNDKLDYNFCFPIIKTDSLPNLDRIHYKQIHSQKAIKAIYNGNYITSDRAWYALLEYAKKEAISVTNKPLEVFFNNPNMGGDALGWKTEIYLPLIN